MTDRKLKSCFQPLTSSLSLNCALREKVYPIRAICVISVLTSRRFYAHKIMTDILLTSVQIIDKQSSYHLQRTNILISGGRIAKIGNPDAANAKVIDASALSVSAGWFDMRAFAGEPGFEYKETIETTCRAAAQGGFTEVAVLPNTQPVIQHKEALAFLAQRSVAFPVQLHAIAALSIDTKGEDMTEMVDLHHAGAVAFSDGVHPVNHTGLIYRTLQYLQQFNGLFINVPDDKHLSKNGVMHEGIASTMLGMKGIPSIAEQMGIQRDLQLLEYAGGRIHFTGISSAESVEMIRQAKKRGLRATCDIAAHQLAFTDDDLADFDTNLKVKPPFRSRRDIDALLAGLADGTIDAIVSAHQPQDEESKKLEFDLAEFGILGLETAFAAARTHSVHQLPVEALVEKFAVNPRRILNLPVPQVAEGQVANLTLFHPDEEWTFSVQHIRSASRNTPFTGKKLKGRAVAIFNKNQFQWVADQ